MLHLCVFALLPRYVVFDVRNEVTFASHRAIHVHLKAASTSSSKHIKCLATVSDTWAAGVMLLKTADLGRSAP